MTDLDDIVFLSTTRSAGENLERIGENIHTRYPLICDEPESFLGIMYVPRVVDSIDELRNGDLTFEDIAVPPMTIDATASSARCLAGSLFLTPDQIERTDIPGSKPYSNCEPIISVSRV